MLEQTLESKTMLQYVIYLWLKLEHIIQHYMKSNYRETCGKEMIIFRTNGNL